MKKKNNGLGIAVFIAMFAFILAACSAPGTDEPNRFINIPVIQGVTAPATGRTPVTKITENEQFNGTITWDGNPVVFAANTQYIATITLTAKNGYTLQGVPANFFIVAGAIMVRNNAKSGVITAIFPITDASISIISAIQGINIPVKGETPVKKITENEQYSGTVTWSPNHSTFAASTVYTATISLTPKSGYTFQGVMINYFTVDGAAYVSNDANSGIITAEFPSTDATVITIAAIQGVTVPINGGTPVTKITENTQYSGTVTWNGKPNTFTAATQYTATIMLTPKTGYTLHGISEDFFTVAGAVSVSNNANSGDITAVFPATASTSITSVSISITAPVKGATPSTTVNGTGNFTLGSVSWSPSDNPFLGNKVYTASVTLTANSGYIFSGLSSAKINGQNATVSNNTGLSVTLSYTFPATNTKTVSGIEIKSQPTKLTYMHGDALDLAGLVVTLIHDDTTTEDIDAANFTAKNITVNLEQGNNLVHSTHDEQPVEIKYGSLTCNTNNLNIYKATPKLDDFNISEIGSFFFDGNPRNVNIIPKAEKTNGTITIKYNGITTEPSAIGEYAVTFDVAVGTNFNAASELSVGLLTITHHTFTSVDELRTYLQDRPYNTASTPYIIELNESSSTGIRNALFSKYVSIDLSGSTFTTIESEAFEYYNMLTSITIPDSVTSIGESAFAHCTSLTNVIIPNSVTRIRSTTFSGCTNLTSITIPDSVTSIGYAAFSQCTSLTDVIIPDSVTYIGDSVFSRCTSLTSVTIGNGTADIDSRAFSGCTSLTNVIILNSVTSINSYFLLILSSFSAINVDATNTVYSSIDGILYNKAETAIIRYPGKKTFTSFTIPNSVTRIEHGAFQSCTNLTSITIPNSVTYISSTAFSGCTNLTSITIPNSVTYIGYNAFSGCTNLTSITIPISVTYIAFGAFSGCTNLTSITIPDSVTYIERETFYGCTSLTSVIISNRVYSIGSRAFYNCTSLTSVTFQGTISYSNFSDTAFPGDLRTKFLSIDATYGTPGTYTRAIESETWTKQ